MSKTRNKISEIKSSSSKKGVISIWHISEPYGKGSDSIVSIGTSLDGDGTHPDWKVHIPYDNIDDVIEALKSAKKKYKM